MNFWTGLLAGFLLGGLLIANVAVTAIKREVANGFISVGAIGYRVIPLEPRQ